MKAKVDKYELDVGILEDRDYYLPEVADSMFTGGDASMGGNLSTFAGGPVRKRSRKLSGRKISDVSEAIRVQHRVDYLRYPVKNPNSQDLARLIDNFFRYAFGRSTVRRLENAVQAFIRNPILRGDYGSNSPGTIKSKGFDRFLIDTGQFFRNIKAKVIQKGR